MWMQEGDARQDYLAGVSVLVAQICARWRGERQRRKQILSLRYGMTKGVCGQEEWVSQRTEGIAQSAASMTWLVRMRYGVGAEGLA